MSIKIIEKIKEEERKRKVKKHFNTWVANSAIEKIFKAQERSRGVAC